MLLFSFGKCSLKYLYPLVAGIIWIPIQYMTTILFINSLFDTDFYSFSPLLYSLLDQIGYILVGLFEILAIYIRRNQAYKDSFCFEFKKRIEKYKSSYKILPLIGALSVLSMLCNIILPTSKSIDNKESFMQINMCCIIQFLIIVLLTTFLLKKRLHRHNYLGMILVILGYLILIVVSNAFFSLLSWVLLYMVFATSLVSVIDVTTKWLMDNKSFFSLEIMFFQGVFGALVVIGIWLGLSGQPCNNNNNFIQMMCLHYLSFDPSIEDKYLFSNPPGEMLFMFSSMKISFITIGYLLLNALTRYFTLQTIYHLGPSLKILAYEVLMFYNAFSNEQYSLNIPSIIILYPIMIIGVLISNEIIIIHPYQLDFYTSDKINERADSILDRDINTINLLDYGGVDQNKEENQEDEIEENIIN